jgi:hypothetical protein
MREKINESTTVAGSKTVTIVLFFQFYFLNCETYKITKYTKIYRSRYVW